MTKSFVAASASADSVYLLYHVLTTTTDDVITRICFAEASSQEIDRKRKICDWLCENVRPFDHGISENEQVLDSYPNHIRNNSHLILMASCSYIAEKHKCDRMFVGFNNHNWSVTNWFYNSDENEEGNESFYDRSSEFHRSNNNYTGNAPSEHLYIIRDFTKMPMIWPFMHNKKDKESVMGRWEVYEKVPQELKSIMSKGCNHFKYRNNITDETCGKCWNCMSYKWYENWKSKGLAAKQIDDMIMREGKYGKYWVPETEWKNKTAAYLKWE
jgi:hypothetical protein